MGFSPDRIIYDPNENPSAGILEIKCLFAMRGKTIEECLELKRDIFVYPDENGDKDPDEIIDTTFNFRTW